MLDKPEVVAEVTNLPRFLPWEFNTGIQPHYECLPECRKDTLMLVDLLFANLQKIKGKLLKIMQNMQ